MAFVSPVARVVTLVFGGGFAPSDVPQSEADALITLYNATNGPSWTNKTNWLTSSVVGSWYGITVSGGHVTQVSLGNNNLNGSAATFQPGNLPNLTHLLLFSNASLSGSVAGWTLPTSLQQFYFFSTLVSGDISGWTLPASLGYFRIHDTSVSGDISGWTLPASLYYFEVNSTSVSGDISSLVLPTTLQTFYVNSTSVSGAPIFTSSVGLRFFKYQDCALAQATVDLIVSRIYNRRASFTYASPSANIGGTNSAPSGTYADEDPPVTGKGFIYELVNDPETEGFKKWAITYTA